MRISAALMVLAIVGASDSGAEDLTAGGYGDQRTSSIILGGAGRDYVREPQPVYDVLIDNVSMAYQTGGDADDRPGKAGRVRQESEVGGRIYPENWLEPEAASQGPSESLR